jgi:hypothetical protein
LSVKETATPEPPQQREGASMKDHELRKRQVDISEIEGTARKAKLFGRDAGGSGQPSKKAIEKVVGSEVSPDRRTDGRPATDEQPVTEQAEEGSNIGETDPEPTIESGNDEGAEGQPSREEIRQRLDEVRQKGGSPGDMPEMPQ